MQSQKLRREELRVHIANIYRTVAENIWPGLLSRKPVFRLHYLKFIDDTTRHILTASAESFHETQPLRYALASVLRSICMFNLLSLLSCYSGGKQKWILILKSLMKE